MNVSESDKVRLKHILDSLTEIQNYTVDASYNDFLHNSMLFFATVKQLEIIGEAANRLSEGLRQEFVEIEWREIIGLRNILIHEYFGIDRKIVWDIVSKDLPTLKEKIIRILEKIS